MAVLDPMPQQDPTVSPGGGWMTGKWTQWLFNLFTRLNACAYQTGIVRLTNQHGAIATTPINGTSAGGRQRVHWYLRVNTGDPAGTLQLQLTWTENGTVLNVTSLQLNPPVAGNVLTGVAYLETDAAAPIDFAVLSGNPGGPAVYRLTIATEVAP